MLYMQKFLNLVNSFANDLQDFLPKTNKRFRNTVNTWSIKTFFYILTQDLPYPHYTLEHQTVFLYPRKIVCLFLLEVVEGCQMVVSRCLRKVGH